MPETKYDLNLPLAHLSSLKSEAFIKLILLNAIITKVADSLLAPKKETETSTLHIHTYR